MKGFKFIMLSLILFSFFSMAQDQKNLENTAEQIFELSKKSDYTNAAKFFACIEDGDGYLKRNVDFNNSEEMKNVKKICKKIKGLLKISSEHKISKHEVMDGLYVCDVNFKSGKQDLLFNVSFIKLQDKFLLVNFK